MFKTGIIFLNTERKMESIVNTLMSSYLYGKPILMTVPQQFIWANNIHSTNCTGLNHSSSKGMKYVVRCK